MIESETIETVVETSETIELVTEVVLSEVSPDVIQYLVNIEALLEPILGILFVFLLIVLLYFIYKFFRIFF